MEGEKSPLFFVSGRDCERPPPAEHRAAMTHLAASSGRASCLAAAASCGARQLRSGAVGGGCGQGCMTTMRCSSSTTTRRVAPARSSCVEERAPQRREPRGGDRGASLATFRQSTWTPARGPETMMADFYSFAVGRFFSSGRSSVQLFEV